jgi:hypothetical protein
VGSTGAAHTFWNNPKWYNVYMDWGFASVHYTKELYMNAIVNNYINALSAHIESGIELSKALDKLLPVYNAAPIEQQLEIRNAVAVVIGKKYKVTPKLMEKGPSKGALGFDAHGTEQEVKARRIFQYYLPAKVVPKVGTKTVRKSTDPVSALLEKFQSLTAAQKRAFLKSI